jgi:hypothetical protein
VLPQEWFARFLPAPLYIGPDQFLPLTSALGAATGLVLLFWHRVVAWARRLLGFFTRRPSKSAKAPDAP